MFKIVVKPDNLWDEEKEEFLTFTDTVELHLEHSLVSLSEWESIWEKPFIGQQDRTTEETLSYIRCMIQNEVDPSVLRRLKPEHFKEIQERINKKMTATTINQGTGPKKKVNNEKITSELVYYWMTALDIPFECQYWHLNRLITLIEVCSKKREPEKKRSRSEIAAEQHRLNQERRAKFNTKG